MLETAQDEVCLCELCKQRECDPEVCTKEYYTQLSTCNDYSSDKEDMIALMQKYYLYGGSVFKIPDEEKQLDEDIRQSILKFMEVQLSEHGESLRSDFITEETEDERVEDNGGHESFDGAEFYCGYRSEMRKNDGIGGQHNVCGDLQ